jgi:hypothetical protein
MTLIYDDNHWRELMATIHSRVGTVKFMQFVKEALADEHSSHIDDLLEDIESAQEWPENYGEPAGSTPSEIAAVQRLKR